MSNRGLSDLLPYYSAHLCSAPFGLVRNFVDIVLTRQDAFLSPNYPSRGFPRQPQNGFAQAVIYAEPRCNHLVHHRSDAVDEPLLLR